MRCPTLLAFAAGIALIVACGDEPTKQSSPSKDATKTATSGTKPTDKTVKLSAAANRHEPVDRSAGPSTVCKRYRAQLAKAQLRLVAAPTAPGVSARVASLQALVADACE